MATSKFKDKKSVDGGRGGKFIDFVLLGCSLFLFFFCKIRKPFKRLGGEKGEDFFGGV